MSDSSLSARFDRILTFVRICPRDVGRMPVTAMPPSGLMSARRQRRGPGVRGSFEKGARFETGPVCGREVSRRGLAQREARELT